MHEGGAVGVMPDFPEVSGIAVGNADAAASPDLSSREVLQEIAYCTPGVGATPCARFVTRLARTYDEDRHELAPIPAYPYVISKANAFERGVDRHEGKTRQMMLTWISASSHLWRIMFVRQSSGFVSSRKEKLVDDGGERSTKDSFMGKMRFIYRNLPEDVQAYAPVTFAKLRVTCPSNDSYVTGEGATGEGGRGSTFSRATVDEAARMEGNDWYSAIRRACPRGLTLQSTPNGRSNVFARVKFRTPGHFEFEEFKWTRHPLKRVGLYYDEHGKPRSVWYDRETASETQDEIAREYDISYEKSVSGQIWPEFDEDRHITWEALIDHDLPLYGAMDFGGGSATTCVFFQLHGREMWILGDYEVWNADVDDHAPALWKKAQALGFRGQPHEIRFYGDPAGNARELTNKNSTVIRAYQAHGFKQFSGAPRRPIKDGIRLIRRKFKRNEIYIHTECSHIRERIGDYRNKTDAMGNVIDDELIEQNASRHLMDAIRYGGVSVFRIDEDFNATVTQPEIRTTQVSDDRMAPQQYEPSVFLDQDRGPGLGTIAPPPDTRY